MLNFIPKRCPSVSLLFGKRPVQRIEVGQARHQLEIPVETIEKIYEGVDSRLEYHNKDYNAMKWKDFMKLKLDAFYLLEASQSEAAAKSALSDLNWFPDLADIYSGQQTMAAMDVALKAQGQQKLSYPIQGKNIK
ncbi:conserved hypothetical protein [Neospora caninum Liverpool]|uniref:Uncharacterized protein n=1 Tax=Neospora caninum (strain Liverpool) TaxID=572307 RepID=F0VQ48_NEOCL|nr:conserved hypothetical protein [Neospora caninum Liverpool]CBZ55845.1 conserved hypothetical protein [Neospora caninum Liverpool]CEL70589.1 TPA: hypothetical protein BN1204_062710 [Neospora caninum Liverpool]|eukprot:XP_003885871.1 conserved hypothetical protein [Neospora caninum Liverpool]